MKIMPNTRNYEKMYTFGTLVTTMSEYEEMKQSFIDAGFTEDDCEYLYIDNINDNVADGYSGSNEFLIQGKGKYIILLHQDVRVIDSRDILEQKIKEMDQKYPNWGILGFTGSNYNDVWLNTKQIKKNDFQIPNTFEFYSKFWNKEIKKYHNFELLPQQVEFLDGAFMIIKKDTGIKCSNDLSGFHFYDHDICLISDILGYTNHVIDFVISHNFDENKNRRTYDYLICRNRLIKKYQKALRDRIIHVIFSTFILGKHKKIPYG